MTEDAGTVIEGIVGALHACACWALHKARSAFEKVRITCAVAGAGCRVFFGRRTRFEVCKVLAVNEDDGVDYVVTRAFVPDRWEASVRSATGWHDVAIRAEVRYTFRGGKYRVVLRPGDVCSFTVPPERRRKGPRGVVAAELVGDGASFDITRRIHKYQGPAKDFHGLRVAVTDMFPYDDADELVCRFHSLRMLDSHFRTHHIPVECDDIYAAVAEWDKQDKQE